MNARLPFRKFGKRAFADFQGNLSVGSRLAFTGKLSNPCAKLLNQLTSRTQPRLRPNKLWTAPWHLKR